MDEGMTILAICADKLAHPGLNSDHIWDDWWATATQVDITWLDIVRNSVQECEMHGAAHVTIAEAVRDANRLLPSRGT